jgi:uracil-DNA glycosylase family 4
MKHPADNLHQPTLNLRPETSPAGEEPDEFGQLRSAVAACQRCPLGATRGHAVFGEGNRHARLMFIGEAPGAQEDESGLPFVGRSGQLLTRVLDTHGIRREDVFISNIVRCRPPANRDPKPDEIKACSPWLEKQIELINPPLLCVLGRHAAATLLQRPVKIMQEHGQWMDFKGRRLLIALHPSAALRMPKFRAGFEHDMAVLAQAFYDVSI